MPNLDDTLELVTQRTGSTSGTPQNEAEAANFRSGIKLDVASIMNQMNSVYYPLFDALSKEANLDALDFGITGDVIFTHANATAASGNALYEAGLGRPRTIKETIDVLLAEIAGLENSVETTVSTSTYDDTALSSSVGTNQLNLKQLRLDAMGSNYGFDNDGAADLTYPLSQAVDAMGAFFSGFPGTGNTYTTTYPTLALAVNLSDVVLDTTIPVSTITSLSTYLGNIHSYTGMSGLSDTAPTYSTWGALTYVSDGQSLEEAIQTLDANLGGGGGGGAFSTAANITSNSPGTLSTDDFVFGANALDDTGTAAYDERFMFDKSKGAFRAGTVNSTQWDDVNRGTSSFAWGNNTTASGAYSIAGGDSSSTVADYSAVLSGGDAATPNTIGTGSSYSVITGGRDQTIGTTVISSAILGGYQNVINNSGSYSVVCGGADNDIAASVVQSAIVGGATNRIYGGNSFIGAGDQHTVGISGTPAREGNAVVCGSGNNITGEYSFIGSGVSNNIDGAATDAYMVIAGGNLNTVRSAGAAIVGGQNNLIDDTTGTSLGGFIGGGNTNSIDDGDYATVVGGQNNDILTGDYSVICGGGNSSAVLGNHITNSPYSFIGAGVGNYIHTATTSGSQNTILGGLSNLIGNSGVDDPTQSLIGTGNGNEINGTSSRSAIVTGTTNTLDDATECFIGGGDNNTISGTSPSESAILVGSSNSITTASGSVVLGGSNNTITSASNATIVSGTDHTLTAGKAAAFGEGVTTGFANGISISNDSTGVHELHLLNWSCTTANATPEELFLDGDGGSAQLTLANDDRYAYVIYVNAGQENTNEVAMYKFEGLIRRDGVASTTTVVFQNKTILHEDNASLDFTVQADTTNGALQLQATGIAAETWHWHAWGQISELRS